MSETESFIIDNDQKAAWAADKIKAAREEIERFKAFYAEQLEKVRQENENTIQFMSALLETYMHTLPAHETATQFTYALPNAKLKITKEKDTLEHDDSALLDYFKANSLPELVKVKESPDWEKFRKMVKIDNGQAVNKETGEIVSCVSVVHSPAVFTVEVKPE